MVGIIKNLFSGKNNYYIELDESEAQNSSQEENTQKTEQKAEPAEKPKAEPKTEETSKTQTQPSSAQPTSSTPQQPVSAQSNGKPESSQLTGETFAPTYLIPKATVSRRRPGANMSEFIEFAREVNSSSR